MLNSIRQSPAIAFFLYVFGIFVVGALLAYPIATALGAPADPNVEFHTVLSRTMKILALVGLFPLMRVLGVDRRVHWGFGVPRTVFLRQLASGLLIGIASLGALAAALLVLGVRVDNPRAAFGIEDLLWLLLKAGVAGLVVGLVEEVWFRGALHSVFQRAFNLAIAVLATAFLYSLVHFLKGKSHMVPAEPDWLSGFEILFQVFGRLASPEIFDSALALFVGGCLLALMRHRTGAIAWCIGVHAGWVIVIKVFKKLTILDNGSEWRWLAGDYDGVIGYLGAAWFTLLTIAYYWKYVRHSDDRRSG